MNIVRIQSCKVVPVISGSEKHLCDVRFFRARDDGNDFAGLGTNIVTAAWCDLTVDDLMQQRLEVEGESTQCNGHGNADAETAELGASRCPWPNIPPATQPPSALKTPRVIWDLRKTRVFLEALATALNDGAWYRSSNKAVARAELLKVYCHV
ncbi:hypothetical protein E4U31_002005 [Claviceps sp. LM219 group G6]|nr:hypothetical protein E4U31_002005 [Claviceps sp. LM219 group G6]